MWVNEATNTYRVLWYDWDGWGLVVAHEAFRLSADGRLFSYEYGMSPRDPADPASARSPFMENFRYAEDGRMTNSEAYVPGERTTHDFGYLDVSGHYLPVPRFGEWDPIFDGGRS